MSQAPGTVSLAFLSRAANAALAALAVIRSTGQAIAPWLDLLIRVWLAQALLAGAAIGVVTHAPPMMVGDTDWVTRFNALVASPVGILIQTICPVLLLIGLASRMAAALLLIQATLLDGPGSSGASLFWTILLSYLFVMGPGSLSTDAILARGLDSSAIPGAARLAAAFNALTRYVGPWYWLVFRVWIVAAPLAIGFQALEPASLVRRIPSAAWLTALPSRITTLPPAVSIALGILLALGLGTRACAVILLLAIPIGQTGMALDDRLYWALLLALLACHGAGPFSIDAWLPSRASALGHEPPATPNGLPHVVIVGGGFGGVAAARGLKSAPCRVTLVDRRNHHLFQPLLYQVATAGLSPADIAIPIRSLFRSQANLRVLLGEAVGVDPASRHLIVDQGRLPYDYLVLATGADHSYFGKDEWAAHAPGLKRIEDATAIRRRLLVAFERAEATQDPAQRIAWMTFLIVGGGPTGVELAGAVAELARQGLAQEFRDIDPGQARVILVQAGARILPTFPETLSTDAAAELRGLGVEIRTDSKVELVDAHGVVVDGVRIEAGTVLWAAGVAASPAGRWLGATLDRAGRLVVGPDLSVTSHDGIFAIGDTAASLGWNGNPVPGLAPAAKQGGGYVARVIRARLAGRLAPKPFRYHHTGSLATIGRRAAVAEFGPLRLRGALAWWIWGAVHILFLAGGRNRTAVIVEWAWAYLTYRRGSRLITDVTSPPKH